jgi:predicted ATPase
MAEERTGGDGPVLLAEGVSFVARPELAGALRGGWVSLTAAPLTILVGVTGVGKSTTLARLRDLGVAFSLLPDRREVADRVIIGTIQALDGKRPEPVTDRVTRLDYTARYRKLFGGGVAHALTRLVIDPARWPAPLLFDGLRGKEEVAYAVDHLPHSRFAVLHAPDEARVRRLLGRSDAFDQTAAASAAGDDALAALRALPGIEVIFDRAALARLAALAGEGGATVDDLVKQVAIVVAERRNYDPDEARRHLELFLPPARLLTIDTAAHDAEAVARRIAEWL